MNLRIFTLTLEPENPVEFSLADLRAHLTTGLNKFTAEQKNNTFGFIYRYPPVHCKIIKNALIIIGIGQGADFLEGISAYGNTIAPGKNACRIISRDSTVRIEQFGITNSGISYEFLTPWLGLNQQNVKKFYELSGKQERDAFLQKILAESLAALAKSLDYKPPAPITCEQKLRFRKDWIDNKSVMVFTGRFRTNLMIPDYLGMGQSVSLGFGTVRRIPDTPVPDTDDAIA